MVMVTRFKMAIGWIQKNSRNRTLAWSQKRMGLL